MRRDDALRILAEHKDEIARYGVKSLVIFGSVARNEARPDSDVDILVEFAVPVGAFKFSALKEYLETLLGSPVDLVPRESVKPRLRDRILEEAINAA